MACGIPLCPNQGSCHAFTTLDLSLTEEKRGISNMNFNEFLHSCSYFDDTKWIDSGLMWIVLGTSACGPRQYLN
jgi:hypothetical protein